MQLTLGDIGDLFKLAHSQQELIAELKKEIEDLKALLEGGGPDNDCEREE